MTTSRQSSKTNERKISQRTVPRSAKTRLSDLKPKGDPRGGGAGGTVGVTITGTGR